MNELKEVLDIAFDLADELNSCALEAGANSRLADHTERLVSLIDSARAYIDEQNGTDSTITQ